MLCCLPGLGNVGSNEVQWGRNAVFLDLYILISCGLEEQQKSPMNSHVNKQQNMSWTQTD